MTTPTTEPNQPDTKAFVRLLLQAEPRIYGYIRSQVPGRADAEDVLQETVAVLWSKFDRFEPGSNFLAWAYQVARYEVLHFRRRQQRLPQLFSDGFVERVAATVEAMSDELGEIRRALVDCMAKLPPRDREVVQLCYGSNATVRKVADELGRPVDTIKSLLRRSRHSLYGCIQRTLSRERQ